MEIPNPDYFLNINGLNHGAMTGQMMEKIEGILIDEKPDFVLVYGDTNSTLAGALAAKKLHIKLAHVEAGLRSFNMKMPEEINRILTDRISDILFCPTDTSVKNLELEGFGNFQAKIIKSGDVMLDAALFYSHKATKPDFDTSKKFILVTLHRAENTDDINNLGSIFSAFQKLSETHQIVLPLHPRTAAIVKDRMISIYQSNIKIVDPVSYFEMIYLIQKSSLVMTDSGGLQKEAFFFKKNCVTLRSETEWSELIDCGCNVLVGADTERIINSVTAMIDKSIIFPENLYGNGHSGNLIVNELLKF